MSRSEKKHWEIPRRVAVSGLALAFVSLSGLAQIKAPLPSVPAAGAVLSKPIKLPPKRQETAEQRNRRLAALPGAGDLRNYVNAYERMLATFRTAHDHYFEALGRCHARSYSVSDQRAAGCSASDSLQQCADKLLSRCLIPGTRGYSDAAKQLNSALNAMRFSAQQGQTALSRDSERVLGSGR